MNVLEQRGHNSCPCIRIEVRRRLCGPFLHHEPAAFDYAGLLDAMRECSLRVQRLRAACGERNPLFEECGALIAEIEAVAILTRIPDALGKVMPNITGHSTSKHPGMAPH